MTIESAGITTLKTKDVIDSITPDVKEMKIISIHLKNVRKDADPLLLLRLSSLLNTLRANTVPNLTIPVPVFKTRFDGFTIVRTVSAKNSFTAVVMEIKTNSNLEAIVRPSVGTLRTSANCKLMSFSSKIKFGLILSQFTTIYHNLPQFTTIYHNLPQFTTIYHNLPQFTTIYHNLPQFTTIYHNLPQFTTIYHNLPQFTTIYLDISIFEKIQLIFNFKE